MRLIAFACILTWLSATASAQAASDPFHKGVTAYESGDFSKAESNFNAAAQIQPASGTFVNQGLAEWRRGRVGPAVTAWERALWLSPREATARNNLRYARHWAELPEPELTWYEAVSTWLPSNTWAVLAGTSLWLAVALMALPGLMRWRRATWQQALAAASLGVFLLCVPAHLGIMTRARLGFILDRRANLQLTPTSDAERLATLAAGEPVRKVRVQGDYLLVRTQHGIGWVPQEQVGLIASDLTDPSASKRSPVAKSNL